MANDVDFLQLVIVDRRNNNILRVHLCAAQKELVTSQVSSTVISCQDCALPFWFLLLIRYENDTLMHD